MMVAVRCLLARCVVTAGCDDVWHLRHVDEPPDAPGVTDLHPEAFYDFEDPADLTGMLRDATGHGHDGACAAAMCPSSTPSFGDRGLAGLFTGTQYVTVPSFAMNEVTVSFWLRLEQPSIGNCVVNRLYGAANENSWQLCATLNLQDQVVLRFHTTEAPMTLPSGVLPMPPGVWRHIVIRWDGSLKSIFFEGDMAISTNGDTRYDGGPIVIGADIDNATTVVMPLNGALDNIAIYTRALDDDEVRLTP